MPNQTNMAIWQKFNCNLFPGHSHNVESDKGILATNFIQIKQFPVNNAGKTSLLTNHTVLAVWYWNFGLTSFTFHIYYYCYTKTKNTRLNLSLIKVLFIQSEFYQYQLVGVCLWKFSLNMDSSSHKDARDFFFFYSPLRWSASISTYHLVIPCVHIKCSWVNHLFIWWGKSLISSEGENLHLVASSFSRPTHWCPWLLWISGLTLSAFCSVYFGIIWCEPSIYWGYHRLISCRKTVPYWH